MYRTQIHCETGSFKWRVTMVRDDKCSDFNMNIVRDKTFMTWWMARLSFKLWTRRAKKLNKLNASVLIDKAE